MDRIIKTSLGIFIIILIAFTGIITFTGYTETAYRNTLTGTYSYSCNITTDSPLYNVTLFIPVPVDNTGNSPMVSEFSNHGMKGVPADWETTLFDTGKSTLLKVMTPAIVPPEGTSAQHPFTITFSSETTSHTPVDSRNPVEKSAMFRPVQALNEKTCPQGIADGASRCFTYTTSLYADYQTEADSTVTITSAVIGKNTWTIFEPYSNKYHTDISTSMRGESHGWAVLNGELSSGIGTYDSPEGSGIFR
jgi:hypothetical protein